MRFRISLRIQFYLLMLLGFSGASLATFAPSLLVILGGVLCLQPLSHFIKHPKMSTFYRTGVREVLLLILAYLLLSLSWTVDAKAAFVQWATLFGVFLGGCFVFESVRQFNHRQKQALADVFVSGMAIATILIAIHISLGEWVNIQFLSPAVAQAGAMEYGSYYIVLLIWPCLAYFLIKGKMRMAIAVALMMVMVLMKMDHAITIAALTVGAAFMALSYYLPKTAVTCFLLLWSGLVISVPVFTAHMDADELVESYGEHMMSHQQHNVYVWELSAKHALQEDPNGTGFNSAGTVKLAKKETLPFDAEATILPLPANTILQLWLELGIVGLFGIWLVGVVLFFVLRNMVASVPLCKVAATAQLASLICLPLFFTSVWNIPFFIIVMMSLLAFHICVSAAARNVI